MSKGVEVENHVTADLLLPLVEDPAHLTGADSRLEARCEERGIALNALLVLEFPATKLVQLVPKNVRDRYRLTLALLLIAELLAPALPHSKLDALARLPVVIVDVATVERLDLRLSKRRAQGNREDHVISEVLRILTGRLKQSVLCGLR